MVHRLRSRQPSSVVGIFSFMDATCDELDDAINTQKCRSGDRSKLTWSKTERKTARRTCFSSANAAYCTWPICTSHRSPQIKNDRPGKHKDLVRTREPSVDRAAAT